MFPDIANVLHIRDALWRHKAMGRATIMVGAGFSRNADPISPSAQAMPTWVRLAESLCDALYPTPDSNRTAALAAATATSGFLRLAQEYHTAFGETALQDHIRGLVPDLDYAPGDLHKRLLRLRWADVFTTNWDTLLERARPDVFERDYDVVRTMGEIPSATRPRIVKLHGTFPAHAPFIFTEEDYRTYPTKFAPFVNLVQQAMMETIFCLLGFSGDDPNFLHWSGWVRDNLGAGAPRIYLVGWLELSNHRRRMLEARNVMPVDLAALPVARDWPVEMRHRFATEWFISALERGKAYSPLLWPNPPSALPPTPPYLGEVPKNESPTPIWGPRMPPFGEPTSEHTKTLLEVVRVWAFTRRLYPGWFVAPEGVRENLYRQIEVWDGEFRYVESLNAAERIVALGELAWRLERTLLPFLQHHEDLAAASVVSINPEHRTLGTDPALSHHSWREVLEAGIRLALALVQNARRSGDAGRFESALQHLSRLSVHDREAKNAATYEECQWKLSTGDLEGLLALLEAWMPSEQETHWNLRKAGLLSEMGEHSRVCVLLERTLAEIRKSRRRDVDDLRALSLEGWALFLSLPYTPAIALDGAALADDMPEPFERWRELSIVNCNARADFELLARSLETNKPLSPPEVTITKSFDPGYRVTHHLSSSASPRLIAAYQMALLAEHTAIPPKARYMNLFKEGLIPAAKALADVEPWLAMTFAIRMGSDQDVIDEVFSRARVARLSPVIVGAVRDALLRRAQFGIVHASAPKERGHAFVLMAASALQLLSRIAVRLPTSELRMLLGEAKSYFRSPVFRRLAAFFGEPMTDLLRRIMDSLPAAALWEELPALFALPLPHDGQPVGDEHRWRDVALTIPAWLRRRESNEESRSEAWNLTIPPLLFAAKGPDKVNRAAAIVRLHNLHGWKILTQPEKEELAAALWSSEFRDSHGLPSHTGLLRWAVLILPEERPGQAASALLNFVADRAENPGEHLNFAIAEIGEILQALSHGGEKRIGLDEKMRNLLLELVRSWASHKPDESLRSPFARSMERDAGAIEGIRYILPQIDVSPDLVDLIIARTETIETTSEASVVSFRLYPLLAAYRPERRPELVERLRRALLSDERQMIRAGVHGLYCWISSDSSASDPSEMDALVREVGVGIAARRSSILPEGLALARWVFEEGPTRLKNLIVDDCDHGLAALISEASYSRTGQEFDVPDTRAAAVRLAMAMAQAGFEELPGVKGWLAEKDNDPLPEVRNASFRQRN